MKKITLFLIMFGFFLTASAQYSFDPIEGPTNVAQGTPVTINLNDVSNSTAVPASSSGSYESFSVTADWVAGGSNPYSSEADLTVITTAGTVVIDPPTTNGAAGDDTVITFEGDFVNPYDPTTDGFLDLILNQSWSGSDADWSNIVVTLFETPTCLEPSGITATGATSESVILDWTAGDSETDWNLEYNSNDDFAPGNGEEESASSVSGTPNITLSGLTAATTYYVYYQANCGTDDLSLWVGPFIFSTECVTFTAPYTEGFENAGDIPLCWSMSGGEDWQFDNDTGFDEIGDNGIITGSTNTNEYFAWVDSSGDDGPSTLTSPLIDVSGLAAPALSFFEISDNQDDANSTLEVEVWDGAAWNLMATYNTNTAGWELKVIDLSTLTITGDVQARFIFSETVTGDFSDDIAIDDVTFDEAPSCFNPSMLVANNITSNSAELSWSQDGPVSMWNIEIVTAGDTPTGTPTVIDAPNPYIATGLDAISAYDFYVQTICSADEMSSWVGPLTFSTLCEVFTPDYIQNFSSVTFDNAPDCWEEAGEGDPTTGPTELGDSSWTVDGFLNDGTTGAYKINVYEIFTGDLNEWILSPQFDLTGGPFQVEFDFGITTWGDPTAGTLGSDDVVQFLISTDNGATWTALITYDSASDLSDNGEHPVIDLTSYSGQIVEFAFYATNGTVADDNDNDVFVDNFRVRGIPTCPEPSDLTANNLSLTSTEISWTENGTATSWNIQYGETNFVLGDGTIETNISSIPYILTDLMPDTSYEFYVSAICGAGNESSYFGPFEFFTGYCESIPTSNDGSGVNNVTVGITDFPSFGDEFYENHTTPVVNAFQDLNTNVEIEFGHGTSYFTSIWIDFNDNLVFDTDELVFEGESSGSSTPHLLDASFIMPATATIGEHRMRIVTHDYVQTPLNPCYSGLWGVTLDFTLNIQELNCTIAEANYTTVPDCDNDQFFIDVNITDLGDATSLEISNNFDAETIQASAIDTYQAGPFPFGTAVKIFVTNEQDNDCVIGSETFEVLACPPSNDECSEAIVAVVNDGALCDNVTPGTILAATPSGIDAGTCGGTPNDDVWFSFTALSELQIISIINITGGTTNLDHAVYDGSCGTLTELYCSDEDSSVTTQLEIGNTYYIRIFSGGSVSELSTFDLCIREAPGNLICENADNFCSVGGALTTPNIVGIDGVGAVACLGTTPNPVWNIIQVGESGPIEIEINQQDDSGNGLDVDFVIWGPFSSVEDACIDIVLDDCPSCPFSNDPDNGFYPFGNIIDCSYSADATENLTIDNAQEGDVYMLLVTNFNGGAGNITIEQTNINGDGSGSIVADIDAEIVNNEGYQISDADNDPSTPDELNACAESVVLEANSPLADEFIWFEDGFVIPNETSSTLTVTAGGFGLGASNYQVQAIDTQCDANTYSEVVVVNLYTDPDALAPQTITTCDGPEADGIELFDLDAFTETLGISDEFTVSFYENSIDANSTMNPVTSPYSSTTGETLVMRIEDTDQIDNPNYFGCRKLVVVNLVVNPALAITQPDPLPICGNVAGETTVDLTSISSEVTTDPNLTVTFHTSQEDADAGTGDVTSTSYDTTGETLYIRAADNDTQCYQTTTFEIIVNVPPVASFDTVSYEVCPEATVPISIGIVPDNFTESDVSVSWTLDGSPFSGSGLMLNNVFTAGVYSATITVNNTSCSEVIETTVIQLESCIFPEGISPNNDDKNDNFDLRSFDVTKLEIFNRNGTLVYSKNNYTNEWVGQTNDGEELPVGTYFYTIIYEGGTKSKSAWVYINR